MKRYAGLLNFLFLICAIPGWASAHASEDGAILHYAVAITNPAAQEVRIKAHLSDISNNTGAIRWAMRKEFGFVRLSEPLISEPIKAEVEGKDAQVKRNGPYEWEIAASSMNEMQLEYTIPQKHRTLDAVGQRDAYEYPYLTADHGFLVTPTLFLYPLDMKVRAISVHFELPDGWDVIAPWDMTAERTFQPTNVLELAHDLIAVGAWHKYEIRADAFEGVIAFAPGQDALEKNIIAPLEQIIRAELKFFGRIPRRRYLFLFGLPQTSANENSMSASGSPKSNSMTLVVNPGRSQNSGNIMEYLVAHEFFHTWTTGRMFPNELHWYWEGFTDYYAYLIPARLNVNVRQSFVEMLGKRMSACANNPLRGTMSLVNAGGPDFFTDRNAYRLTYDGGLLLAAWLDQAIRKHNHDRSLDDLMRTFNNNPQGKGSGAMPTLSEFLTCVAQFTNEKISNEFEQFVRQPFAFDPVVAFEELGIPVHCKQTPLEKELRANLEGTRLMDIDPSCAAYKVGLRADDRVLTLNGQEVNNSAGLRKAWQEPQNGRIRILLRRGEQEISIDEAVPDIKLFVVPLEPWSQALS